MQDGIYVARFRTAQSIGAGVVTIINNRVTGGDTSYVYTGNLDDAGGTLKGQVAVQQRDREAESVFGGATDFSLAVTGAVTGNGAHLTGALHGQGIQIELARFHAL
jgi:hypothetical protein